MCDYHKLAFMAQCFGRYGLTHFKYQNFGDLHPKMRGNCWFHIFESDFEDKKDEPRSGNYVNELMGVPSLALTRKS